MEQNENSYFSRIKFCDWPLIAGLMLLHISLSAFMNGVLFQEPVFSFIVSVMNATGGWLHPTLVANVLMILIVIGGGVVGLCKWRVADLRWIKSHLMRGFLVLAVLILIWQASMALSVWLRSGQLALNPEIEKIVEPTYLGALLAQLAGNALYEETFFRAFLFSQLLVWGRQKWNESGAMLIAALLSQAFFALSHLPNRLFVKGLTELPSLLTDQASLFFMGIVFLLLWLFLQNLWVVVGMHALLNKPFGIFANTVNELQVVLVLFFFATIIFCLKKSIRNRLAIYCTGGRDMLTYPPPSPTDTPPGQTAPGR